MAISVNKANDKYRASLRSTWISSPPAATLAVTAIPANIPTIVCVGWRTEYETYFTVTGSSGSSAADYTLTGATRLKGANVNIPENTAVNCLNNEEFFNQYETYINQVLEGNFTAGINVTGDAIVSGDATIGGSVDVGAGENVTADGADPNRTIYIGAGVFKPATTAGCADSAKVEAGTNKIDYDVLDFDKDTAENAYCNFVMPVSYDGGTITAKFIWTAASGSGAVVWGLKGRAIADDGAIDQANGTGVTATDTLITAGDIHISPATTAITLAGSPTGGQWVHLVAYRLATDGSDTLAVDARLLGVIISYKQGQLSD